LEFWNKVIGYLDVRDWYSIVPVFHFP